MSVNMETPTSIGGQGQTTTMEQMVEHLNAMIAQLQEEVTMLRSQQQVTNEVRRGAPKLRLPEPFDGDPKKLKAFLTGMKHYCSYYAAGLPRDADKIEVAARNMKGDPAMWMQPYLEKHLIGDTPLGSDAREIFRSWDSFENYMKKMYGGIDEQARAVREMESLKQTGSAQKYTTRFKQLQALVEYEEEGPLLRHYYNGLKEFIKDELARQPKPTTLNRMITLVNEIDERAYERTLEKKNGGRQAIPNTPKKRIQYDRDGDVVMKAAQATSKDTRDKKSKKKWSKEKEQRYRDGVCLGCGKKGHFARECPDKDSHAAMVTTARVAMVSTNTYTQEQVKRMTHILAELGQLDDTEDDVEAQGRVERWAEELNATGRRTPILEELEELLQRHQQRTSEETIERIVTTLQDAGMLEKHLDEEQRRNEQTSDVEIQDISPLTLDERPPTPYPRIMIPFDDYVERLRMEQCWTCGSGSHEAQECKWARHKEVRIVGERHDRQLPEQRILATNKSCTTKERLPWYECCDDECPQCKNAKHWTGYYPRLVFDGGLRQPSYYEARSETCENRNCERCKSAPEHFQTAWFRCARRDGTMGGCEFHWFQEKAITMDDSSHAHAYLPDCDLAECWDHRSNKSDGYFDALHSQVSWQHCYRDACNTHWREKEMNWYPQPEHEIQHWSQCEHEHCLWHIRWKREDCDPPRPQGRAIEMANEPTGLPDNDVEDQVYTEQELENIQWHEELADRDLTDDDDELSCDENDSDECHNCFVDRSARQGAKN
jgi:hypothetical protein